MRKWIALVALLTAPLAAQAQIRVICQTPAFWCTFLAPVALPNGAGCHCGTPRGPAFGYSMVDVGMPVPQSQPPQPVPQPVPPGPQPQSQPSVGDCYRGLGNCGGAYSDSGD
jgi:hypothetical protein